MFQDVLEIQLGPSFREHCLQRVPCLQVRRALVESLPWLRVLLGSRLVQDSRYIRCSLCHLRYRGLQPYHPFREVQRYRGYRVSRGYLRYPGLPLHQACRYLAFLRLPWLLAYRGYLADHQFLEIRRFQPLPLLHFLQEIQMTQGSQEFLQNPCFRGFRYGRDFRVIRSFRPFRSLRVLRADRILPYLLQVRLYRASQVFLDLPDFLQ